MNTSETPSLEQLPEAPAAAVTVPPPVSAAPLPSSPVAVATFSGLGLTSILFAVAGGIGLFIALGYMAVKQLQTGVDLTGNSGIMMVVGLGIIASGLMLVVGAILGFVGLFQPGRKKLLPVLGIGFNLMVLVVIGILMAIGLSQ